MANNASARKRIRVNLTKALRNRSARSEVKTYVVKFRRTADLGELDQARELMLVAISALDRAAAKGVVHRNNAARRKSRLMRRMALLASGATPVKHAKGSGKAKSAGGKAAAKKAAAKSRTARKS